MTDGVPALFLGSARWASNSPNKHTESAFQASRPLPKLLCFVLTDIPVIVSLAKPIILESQGRLDYLSVSVGGIAAGCRLTPTLPLTAEPAAFLTLDALPLAKQ